MPFQFVIPYIIISVYCVLKPLIIDVLATVFYVQTPQISVLHFEINRGKSSFVSSKIFRPI